MNVLIVTAHHDDLELGCGGTVAKFIEQGHRVVSLVLTHSGYSNAQGVLVRSREDALREATQAAASLGYHLVSGEDDTFDIAVKDANTCRILAAIQDHGIDTIFTHWHGDTHPPHQSVHTMVIHAARRVPRLFGFAVNWYMGSQPFAPQMFVPLSEAHWQQKLRALQSYATEHQRAGNSWVEYFDHQTLNFGRQLGVARAEGFVVYKSLWEF
jgi:LmbE family N-acetylglucosaminyl deacetylase